MSERGIRYFGDPILKSVCDPVRRFDKKLRDLVNDLLETTTPSGRAGVAANQIGVAQRVFAFNVDDELGYVVNPEIVELGAEVEPVDEGCLSVPGLWYPVERHTAATVKGVDVNNEPVTVSGTGTLAQCLQHETDHLDGYVYLDRLDRAQRGAALREIRASDWF